MNTIAEIEMKLADIHQQSSTHGGKGGVRFCRGSIKIASKSVPSLQRPGDRNEREQREPHDERLYDDFAHALHHCGRCTSRPPAGLMTCPMVTNKTMKTIAAMEMSVADIYYQACYFSAQDLVWVYLGDINIP